MVNNGQNLVNVVCERPPNAACSLDFKAVSIVKSVKLSINQLSPTGPWRQLWEVTWYKLMVSSPLECWELFATWFRCLCWNLLPSKGLCLLNKPLPDGFWLPTTSAVMPEPGRGAGGQRSHCPPIFGRSVNPIPTGGGQIIPTYYYFPPKFFHPPALLSLLPGICMYLCVLALGFGKIFCFIGCNCKPIKILKKFLLHFGRK